MFGVDFVDLFSSPVFLDYLSPLNICCKGGLVVLNSLNFCFSEKLFISPSILNEILVRYSNLDCRFFPFNTLNISCHSLLGFNCGFISTSACGSSIGVCSWGCPGGVGFAPVRARCGGGAAAWVSGVLAAPGNQGLAARAAGNIVL